MAKFGKFLLLLGCLSFIAWVVYLSVNHQNGSSPPSASSSHTQSTPQASPSLGEDGVIDAESSGYIWGASDEASYDAMIKAKNVNDGYAAGELAEQGKVNLNIARGTQVRIIDRSWGKTRVRVLVGIFTGEAYWVDSAFVQKQPIVHPEPEQQQPAIRKGGQVQVAAGATLYFNDSPYAKLDSIMIYEVLEYRGTTVWVAAADQNGKEIALHVEQQYVQSLK